MTPERGKKIPVLKTQSTDTILKNEVGGLILPELKSYYKAIVIKALYWQNSKQKE